MQNTARPTVRMPRARCKISQDCLLCPQRIKAGMWMGKDFQTNEWVHVGCLVRKINSRT